jgi:hypothetical protein
MLLSEIHSQMQYVDTVKKFVIGEAAVKPCAKIFENEHLETQKTTKKSRK